ncbi:MAG: spherulation-specific family 4 protein [Clostridiales bacterium]
MLHDKHDGIFTKIYNASKKFVAHFESILSRPTNYSVSGLIVPLYTAPGDDWTRVINEKLEHPLVPIIAIVNPQNGSGTSQIAAYTDATKQLEVVHVTVLGYVYTGYGGRNSTDVKNEISNYKNWYHADGIFFDEMSSVPGNEMYYKDLSNYAKSLGMKYTVGNPGRSTSASYVGTVDNLVVYDNPGLPQVATISNLNGSSSKNDFAIMAFGVDHFNQSYVANTTQYVKYLYITNGTLPDPWMSVSPYLDNLTATMQGLMVSENQAKAAPPLRQLKSGVAPSDVTCSYGFQLVLKKESGIPACVKPESVSVLIQRNWGDDATQ